MSDPYERLNVSPIINAVGTATRLSGGIMRPEVADAMRQASQFCVDMAELEAAAGAIIARLTGAEAGYVTSGAAAGLLLGTAACVTGLDLVAMDRLPDTRGLKNRVLIPRSHRNFYDHAVRAVGVKLVEVGIPDRFSGAGVRDTEAWEIAAAIDAQTAAICYVASPQSLPPLEQVVEVARAGGVPVLVDAAAQLPPATNLRRFIDAGADLVAFSGGKAIGGPQASGILCGRRDLIAAAALQHLDFDVLPELWRPPHSLIPRDRVPGAPHHGLGRPCKVGKEEIVGLVTALQLFAAEDPQARRARWLALMEELVHACEGLPHASVEIVADPKRTEIPAVRLKLDESDAGLSAVQLLALLQDGRPAIYASPAAARDGCIGFSPLCLRAGEPTRIARRLHELLAAQHGGA
jgi:D-glucosaminate-6-phosphate ammonia-lyase